LKSIKRKQKWQLHRLLFKKRRLRKKITYTRRLSLFLVRKQGNKPTITSPLKLSRSSLKNLRQQNYSPITTTVTYSTTSIPNNIAYVNHYKINQNLRRHLLPFLTSSLSINALGDFLSSFTNISDLPMVKKYSLASLIFTGSSNSSHLKHTSATSKWECQKRFTLSRASLKTSMSAWSYNTTNVLSNHNKSYSMLAFSDGFIPILALGTILSRPQLATMNNLPISPLVSSNSRLSLRICKHAGYLLPPKTLHFRVSFIKQSSHRLASHRKLRTRKPKVRRTYRYRKLLRSNSIRSKTLSYYLNGWSTFRKHITPTPSKFFTSRKSYARLVNTLKGILYAPRSTTTSYAANLSTFSELTTPTLFPMPKLFSKTHSYSSTPGLFKSVYRLQPRGSTAFNNLYPAINPSHRSLYSFRPTLTKDLNFYPDVLPWVNDSIVRLIEHSSGQRSLLQHSMHAENMVDLRSKLEYKKWITRMSYYERNLGHRFFMEEALHIIHLSFRYHDVTLFSSWLKAIITRISFWKTRSIFRFLKYVFNNYYRFIFDSLSIKGIKIRLKGKISAAGNSRKRTILFRSGKNSYSSVNIKCIHDFKTITTFTGVMGFQVWMFY
jgi:hypothetical protein